MITARSFMLTAKNRTIQITRLLVSAVPAGVMGLLDLVGAFFVSRAHTRKHHDTNRRLLQT